MVKPATDAAVIAASRRDSEEFSPIYERHHDDVFRYVARSVGPDRAADLTAEVFVRAFRLRFRYDTSRSSCRPWLFGIASNVIGDDLRRHRRRERRYLALAGLSVSAEDPFGRVDDQVSVEGLGAALDQALRSLRSVDRELLLLRALGELTYEEAAEALGIPVGTVRSRLARARAKLQRMVPEPRLVDLRDRESES